MLFRALIYLALPGFLYWLCRALGGSQWLAVVMTAIWLGGALFVIEVLARRFLHWIRVMRSG